jgi:Pilus formation protein N terminal region
LFTASRYLRGEIHQDNAMHLRRSSPWTPLLGLFAAGAVLAVAAHAHANEIHVPLDNAQMLTFSQPMRAVSIGNPMIADVTVIDRTHVLIMGKTFGSTNIIALDPAGREAMNDQIIVTGRPGGTIIVQRGVARTTLMCTADHCEADPTPGDDAGGAQKLVNAPFAVLSGQSNAHEGQADKAADGK